MHNVHYFNMASIPQQDLHATLLVAVSAAVMAFDSAQIQSLVKAPLQDFQVACAQALAA